MPKLVIFRGDHVETEARLAGRPVRIGRDNRNDIVLDDKSVSRFHAEVRPEGNKYFIADLKSRNGIWVNGQQAKGKTALELGAPVTLGAFELTLEDDVGTGEYDESPLLVPRTVVNAPVTDQADQAGRSATRASLKAPATTKRPVVLWSGAAAAVLLICGVTFAVIRYRDRPATIVDIATPPEAPPAPPIPFGDPVAPPPVDPTRVTIDRHLEDAQAALGKSDYTTVREHVARVLDLDPGNQTALDLRRKADAAAAASGGKDPKAFAGPITTTVPPFVETPGIPRRPDETDLAYKARVEGIRVNLETAKNYLAKQDFANALARLRLVEGAQKGYLNVEALIADTVMKQRAAFDTAMDGGQKNETAGKLRDARRWYQSALVIDPNATIARDKDVALLNRMTPDATRLLNRASSAAKTDDVGLAMRLYNQIVDMLLPGDEIREKAAKELEALKR